eukprot:gb/GEZJ01005990.1/.p2 GENE.gb/GEZJ01005990.1/~~gb/GEZJ01005990.1/.p2  ORF type:complete len:116 (+),score=3.16 gb/GEZJ01005990.1/:93-440(+)
MSIVIPALEKSEDEGAIHPKKKAQRRRLTPDMKWPMRYKHIVNTHVLPPSCGFRNSSYGTPFSGKEADIHGCCRCTACKHMRLKIASSTDWLPLDQCAQTSVKIQTHKRLVGLHI